MDNETGKVKWIDASRGLAKDPAGDPISPPGLSPLAVRKPKATPPKKA